jgi:hypothetical protein
MYFYNLETSPTSTNNIIQFVCEEQDDGFVNNLDF